MFKKQSSRWPFFYLEDDGFWPDMCIPQSEAMCFSNGEVQLELNEYDHVVGHACNLPPTFFPCDGGFS